jgi:uncharacterized membrane protein
VSWTFVRYLHILSFVFFVGGQLMLTFAVGPAVRKHGSDAAMRAVARRFGMGSALALGVLIASGSAMASHYHLWHSRVFHEKLAAFGVVLLLLAAHVVRPRSRPLSYVLLGVSLLVVWLGVKLTYG